VDVARIVAADDFFAHFPNNAAAIKSIFTLPGQCIASRLF
jgi:hypothetical protein